MDEHQEIAVVIGGSSGVGLAAVRRLEARGLKVIAASRGTARPLDATDRAALDAFFAEIGRFDHLVLTLSGGEGAGLFASLDLAALERGFAAKFWPQVNAVQAALPYIARGGSITLVTAISARIANPSTAGLGAINGALESMIGTLAREIAPTRVNAVSPGVIDTPWWNGMPADTKESVFQSQRDTLPAGRVGQPDDVAQVIDMLTGNGFITGATIPCDGGLHLL